MAKKEAELKEKMLVQGQKIEYLEVEVVKLSERIKALESGYVKRS